MSPEEIRYLIKAQLDKDELFEGIETEEVDVDEMIAAMAKEGAWPDGDPRAWVNDIIPDELASLSEDLESLADGERNAAAIDDVREKLRAIKDGNYTFHFTITNYDGDYYFDENAAEKIPLTAQEAIGLLYGKYNLEEVFEGICKDVLDDDFINGKAEIMDFAGGYDYFTYSGECEGIEKCVDAWVYVIESILLGEITEETLDSWTEYFDDPDNFEYDIEGWHEDREEED